MADNTNLPIPVNQKQIEMKQKISRIAKGVGWSAATLGTGALFVVTFAISPFLAVPALGATYFVGKKMLNNTVYESFKDIALVLRKDGNKAKIFQDESRLDIYNKMLGFSKAEKAAFLQLQGLVGLSKCDKDTKKGKPITYQTTSHKAIAKTLKKLENLGYIQEYSEVGKGKSHLVLPRLAFGNVGDIKDPIDMYEINFKLSDKKIDFNDEALRKSFPLIFNKEKGIISKFNLLQDEKGAFTIEYKSKNKFKEELQESAPTLKKQAENSQEFLNKNMDKTLERNDGRE